MVGKKMHSLLPGVNIQIPRTCDYLVNGELRLLIKLRLLISWPWDREGILVYPSVPNVIKGSLWEKERGRDRWVNVRVGTSVSGAKNFRHPLEAGKGKVTFYPRASKRNPGLLMLWFLAQYHPFRFPASRTIRAMNLYFFNSPSLWFIYFFLYR